VLFDGRATVGVGITADFIGLMVITLERYFKIVHAIAHRKYYRNWMTKVGVALPWIGGVSLILFPGIGTTRFVNGQCLRMGVWPNETMAKVSPQHIFVSTSVSNYTYAPTVKCKSYSIYPSVCDQPPRSTQPGHPFVGRRNEYQPKGGDALRLRSKCRYGSCVSGR